MDLLKTTDREAAYEVESLRGADDYVREQVVRLHAQAYPEADSAFIPLFFRTVKAMFEGKWGRYQAIDTAYHDFEHTLQATLCWTRLVANRHLCQEEPLLDARMFHIGLVAVLLHDVGYLKEVGDKVGTGAKFTFVHERRSCEIAQLCLSEMGWPVDSIFSVQHCISCTGPRAVISSIPFRSREEKILGQSICTADYIGQMSDPAYVEKLPTLFCEFEESDNFRQIPTEERLFPSAYEMIARTPQFWEHGVLPKLQKECGGLFRFLEVPYSSGHNPYFRKIEANIDRIRSMDSAAIRALAGRK